MTEENHAKEQAKAQFESICEMVAAFEVDYDRLEELQLEYDAFEVDTEIKNWPDLAEYTDLKAAAGDATSQEDAQEAIQQDPLSVQVRTGWYTPGTEGAEAEEFEILLCTGGPAVRLIGGLNGHNQPVNARMQYQDWGTPWTDYYAPGISEMLQKYASRFWFGE